MELAKKLRAHSAAFLTDRTHSSRARHKTVQQHACGDNGEHANDGDADELEKLNHKKLRGGGR